MVVANYLTSRRNLAGSFLALLGLLLAVVERTAFEDLPTALDAYLRLPQGYVSSGPGSRGRPAIDVLLKELDVMDAEMRLVAAKVQRADMDRLLAHERFLLDRSATRPDSPG